MVRVRRLVTVPLAVVALLAGMAVPAEAMEPPAPPAGSAVIQREITLGIEVSPGSIAWLVYSGNRVITLAAGKYFWRDQFYWDHYENVWREKDRDIDLAAGEYQWNCRVMHVSHTELIARYTSYCFLYREETGSYAYTPTLDFNLDDGYVTWRSVLVRK